MVERPKEVDIGSASGADLSALVEAVSNWRMLHEEGSPGLTQTELNTARRKAEEAKGKLVTLADPIVVARAKAHQADGVPMRELLAVGREALRQAVEDISSHKRRYRFSTYATKAIEDSLLKRLRG